MGIPRLVAKPGIHRYFAYFTAAGNTLFFAAEGGSSGRELWKSDGTAAGTSLVKDIYPGISDSFPFGARLTAIGNTLFFFANDGSSGNELWKSDGTTAGTSLVKDIYPGIATNGSHGDSLTAAGNAVYFSADDGSNGNELWRSDGTTAGTTLLKDILPGPWGSTPRYLTEVGNTLYFTADDIDSWFDSFGGWDLWKSDGTTNGTSLALDIVPGTSPSVISELTAAGNTLFFVLGDFLWPRELWKSDDTGTTRVASIRPGSSSSYDSLLTAVGSTLFFAASEVFGEDRELWKSDGTTAGTVRVKDIRPGSASSYPDKLIAVGNTLFFTARDGSYGEELWKSDGTSAGTTLVKDIAYSADYPSSASSYADDLTAVGNTLYFTADNGISGRELWKSDGTSAGTTLVADLTPGSNSSDISNIKLVGNTLFFSLGTDLWAMNISEDLLLPTVSFAAPPAAVTEDGPSSLAYTLSRTGSTSSPLTVSISLGGSASSSSGDYANPSGFTLSSGFLTFVAGSSTATLTIDPSSDAEVEADETVIISLNPGIGYAIGATATATGTILNDDSQIEAKGNASLNRRSDGQAVVQQGATSFSVSSPWGANTGDTNSDWLMLAAESIGGINQILWRYKPTNQIHTWTLNPNWAWQSSSPLINRASPETWAIESGFQADLNGDSIIGSPHTAIETKGNASLFRRSDGNALALQGTNSFNVSSPWGANTGDANSDWLMLAAESIGGINQILWRYKPTNQIHAWTLNPNWAWQSSSPLINRTSPETWSIESGFQIDLNGDSIIGTPFTPIESNGNATLLRRNDGQAVVQHGATSFSVSSPWGANTGDANSDWLMLAAESIGGINQILWRYKPTNQIHTWTLNPNWAWQSSSPLINRASPETWAIESGFQIDLNGDSIIGTPLTPIETKGNATLLRRNDGQAVVQQGATSFDVSSPWGANTGDTNSDWLMLAAESIGGNNQILWRYKPTNQIHTWTLSPNWAWQSSSPLINRTSPETWAIESGFQIDLNGDSIIGTP